MRTAVDILIDRPQRSMYLRLFDSLLQLVLGRLHQGRVEGATHLQRQSSLGSCFLQQGAGLVDGLDVARDDQLAGVVIVGTHHDMTLAVHLGADFLYLLVGHSDDGSHRRGSLLAGFLHGHRTGVDQPQTVLERQSAGNDQCRELSQRVTSHHAGLVGLGIV